MPGYSRHCDIKLRGLCLGHSKIIWGIFFTGTPIFIRVSAFSVYLTKSEHGNINKSKGKDQGFDVILLLNTRQ